MTRKRWEILKVMTAKGDMSIREVSRLLECYVKSVHGDIHALLEAGVIQRTENGKIVFPYKSVHADFMLTSAG